MDDINEETIKLFNETWKNPNGITVMDKPLIDFILSRTKLAYERGREDVITFLRVEKSTYSEDVAQRERAVYDHIIKCLEESRTSEDSNHNI